jgi:hypothetical protein
MQAVVDRAMRAFTLKHPISDEEADAIRREATEFAVDLLAKYKNQLSHRRSVVRRSALLWKRNPVMLFR